MTVSFRIRTLLWLRGARMGFSLKYFVMGIVWPAMYYFRTVEPCINLRMRSMWWAKGAF